MKRNLFEMSNSEKFRILEMHYKASGKSLLKEQGETTEPDLSQYDWSVGGTVEFWDADLNMIINYIIAVDSTKPYSKLEVYAPIMEWFKTNVGKKITPDDVKKSLYTWVGENPYYGLATAQAKRKETGASVSDYQEVIDSMNNLATKFQGIVDQLKGTSQLDADFKAQLAMVPKILLAAIKSKVYLSDNVITAYDNLANSLISSKDKPNERVDRYGFLTNGGYNANDVKLVTKTKENLKSSLEGGKSGDDAYSDITVTDNERLKMLSDIQNRVTELMNNPQKRDGIRSGKLIKLTIPEIIKEADVINFTQGGQEIKGQESGVGTKKTVTTLRVLNFSYPDDATEQTTRDAQADTFFIDDGTQISDQADTQTRTISMKMARVIRDLQKQYGEDKVSVLNIGIGSYASTSTVNTSFGTGAEFKTEKVFNKANNKKLVAARLNAIDSRMREHFNLDLNGVLDENGDPVLNKVTTLVKQSEANKGPEWTSVGGSNYGITYGIQSYGPLFQAAYAQNPKLTPKKYYYQRKNNEQIAKDYEQTYAGYRKAMVGISVQLQVPQELANLTPTGEYVVSSVGDFVGEISWSKRKKIEIDWPKIGKIKFGNRFPRGFMPSGGRSTACPKW